MRRHALARQLAVIMFTDMVGFTALAQRSEAVALRLLREQRTLVRRLLPRFGGREVKTIGDGFLIHFGSALHATQCALAIQQQMAAQASGAPPEARVQLRIGLHLGDIERPRRDLLGDSVNLAARIQSVAPVGGVAMSGIVYEHIRNQLPAPFEFHGRVALKNVERPVALFVLESAPLAALPPILPPARRSRLPRRAWLPLATLALAAGLGVAVARLAAPGAGSAVPSLAVLPLANLGGEGSAALVDGVHDALITRLSGLDGMKVISRTSVLEYRGAARKLDDIAADLGAGHVVEGAVQQSGTRVRVSARLIEASSGRDLWAGSYDRSLDDLFAIQSELANNIAQEIRARLTPDERRQLSDAPTRNAGAYQLYLRALALEREDRFSAGSLARIEALLEQALVQDPNFALAAAALARVRVYWFDAGHEGAVERLSQARLSAQQALRLSPGLPEAHLALGLYHYYGFLDFKRALVEFDAALARQPSGSVILAHRGFVLRRMGRLPESLASLEQALELDPRNPLLVYELAATHAFLREDAAAARVCRRLPRAVAQAGDFRAQCLVFAIRRSGDLEPAHALERELAMIPAAGPDRHWVQYELALNEGRYEQARTHLLALGADDLGSWAGAPPREMLLGDIARWQGDAVEAQRLYAAAEPPVRERIAEYSATGALVANRAFARALHGKLLARLGRREAALEQARVASGLLPESFDRFYGASLAEEVAKIHLELGDTDRALQLLEALLANPGHTHIQDLRLQRQWSGLWDHPRFAEMVQRYSHR